MYLIGLLLGYLLPETTARVDSIELEGKGPSFWIFIIVLKNVNSAEVDPLIDWFLDG